VPGWCRAGGKPSSSAATPYGDQYRATISKVPGKGKLTLTFVGEDGRDRAEVFNISGQRHRHGDVHLDDSIRDFAVPPLNFGLPRLTRSIWSTKNTIVKSMTAVSRTFFDDVYEKEFKAEFEKKKISNEHG